MGSRAIPVRAAEERASSRNPKRGRGECARRLAQAGSGSVINFATLHFGRLAPPRNSGLFPPRRPSLTSAERRTLADDLSRRWSGVHRTTMRRQDSRGHSSLVAREILPQRRSSRASGVMPAAPPPFDSSSRNDMPIRRSLLCLLNLEFRRDLTQFVIRVQEAQAQT